MTDQHHSHGHDHSHVVPETFGKAFALAVTLNFAFVIIEAIYAVSANSMSLLADAGHNLGDVLGLAMAWGASWLLTKSATQKYSYGFKRTSIIAAILNALILVFTSGIIAYESIIKLIHPGEVHELTVIIIAFIGILINGGTALLFMRGRKDDLNIKAAFLHLAYDALISLGVVITGVIILFTHWVLLDPIVGLLIVVAILLGTWRLLIDSVNLILDAVPHTVDIDAVRTFLEKIEGVTALHDLHVWGLSTKEVALTAHLVMPEKRLSDTELHKIKIELKQHYKIDHVTLQVEAGDDSDACQQDCQDSV